MIADEVRVAVVMEDDNGSAYRQRGGEVTVVHVSWERELQIMGVVAGALERLDQPARNRVLRWARDRYLSWSPLSDDGDA